MIDLCSFDIEPAIFSLRRKCPGWFIARAVVDAAEEDGDEAVRMSISIRPWMKSREI